MTIYIHSEVNNGPGIEGTLAAIVLVVEISVGIFIK
jgi:hypothetical protein